MLAQDYLYDPQKLLPRQQGTAWLTKGQGAPVAEMLPSSIELEISVTGLTAKGRVDDSHCRLKLFPLDGCYDCESGALLCMQCSTDFGETVATIECANGTIIFSAKCDSSPIALNQTTSLNLEHSIIDEECVAHCPASSIKVKLTGTLAPPSALMHNALAHLNGTVGRTPFGWDQLLTGIHETIRTLFNFWNHYLFLGLFVLIGILIFLIAPTFVIRLPYLCIYLTLRLIRRCFHF